MQGSSIVEQLRHLAGVEADRPVVVTCYLDTDGRSRPRHGDLVQAAEQVVRMAKASAEAQELDREARQEVEAGFAAFLRAVGDLVERGDTRGLAMFTGRSLGLGETIRLPLPVRDRGVVGRRPFLLPLEAAVAGHAPLGLVLTDRERARLAIYQLGTLQELPPLVDEVPAQTSGGGWAQARLARHSDEAAHQHAKRVAEAAFQAFRDVDGLEVVLSGPDPAVTATAGCLRPELAGRVCARLHLPVATPAAELTRVLAGVEAGRAAERRDGLVERLRTEVGSAAVAVGLGEFLDAVRERRVAVALAADTLAEPGAWCPTCHTLSLDLDCPTCKTPTLAVDDVVEPALEEALRTGARVLHVPPGGGLEAVGGIGALLRY